MTVYELKDNTVQRDMDLTRDLLLRIERDPTLDGKRWVQFEPADLGMPDRSPEEIKYHLGLLIEAGFVMGKGGFASVPVAISRLTWAGHEFLENIRDPGIWDKTKTRFAGLASVSLTVVAAIAEAEIKKRLGL